MATDVPPGELRPNTEKVFESSRVASKPDGWITTNGVFYACAPDEHDKCAQYLLETQRKFIESLLTEKEEYGMMGRSEHSPRTILQKAGFAI